MKNEMVVKLHACGRLAAFLAAVLCCCAAGANTIWVDQKNGTDGGAGTQADPCRTIQQGVNRAGAGDTVKVLPGDYADGVTNVVSSLNRVYVDRSNLTIEATGGAEVTRIIGAFDTTASSKYGMGAQAVRCVLVKKDANVIIKNFTITGGASGFVLNAQGTGASDVAANRGGAVSTHEYSTTASSYTLVDCIITNNVGTRGGALYGGRAARCRLIDNRASNYGHAARDCVLYNCLVVKNGPTIEMMRNGVGASVGVIAYGRGVYNCTIADNYDSAAFAQTTSGIYNSIVVSNYSVRDAGADSYFHNCVLDKETNIPGGDNCVYGTINEFHSPAEDDYRLDTEAVSLTVAKADYISSIPEAYRDKDLLGNPRTTDGKPYCGAVQGTSPTVARVKLGSPSGLSGYMYMNGVRAGRRPEVFVGAESLPATVLVKFVPHSSATGVVMYTYGLTSIRPAWNDEARFAFTTGDRSVTVTLVPKYWVDADGGSDTSGDGTFDLPYSSIQKALDVTSGKSRVICAKPGIYRTGEKWLNDASNRVAITGSDRVRLTSSGGRDVTTILGASDPGSADGRGTNALRCVVFSGAGHIVSGFTFSGGRSSVSVNDADGHAVRGGGTYVNTAVANYADNRPWVLDCIYTNCCASRGASAWGGVIERCIITDCSIANNGVMREAYAYACLFTGNKVGKSTSLGMHCTVRQCTVDGEIGTMSPAATLSDIIDFGIGLVLGTVSNGKSLSTGTYPKKFTCSLYRDKPDATIVPDFSVVQSETCLMDDGTFRLSGAARAVGMLSWEDVTAWTDVWGCPYKFDASGRTVAGAVADTVPGIAGFSTKWGGITPSGLLDTQDAQVTFTAGYTDRRRLLGFEVNGVLEPAAGSTITVPWNGVDSMRVVAVYSTNYYVNATGGSNSADGGGWDAPLATPAEASRRSEPGDVVTVAPGVYSTDTILPPKAELYSGIDATVPARLFVKRAVLFQSMNGRASADATIIEGAKDFSQETGNENGLGANAVRGAYVAPEGTLRGFTLRGGATKSHNGALAMTLNDAGGGVWAAALSATVEWCTLTNNVAGRCGGTYGGVCKGCRYFDNKSEGMGSAARGGEYYNCIFDFNQPTCIVYGNLIENCTFGPSNDTSGGVIYSKKDTGVRGCVFNTIVAVGGVAATCISNVVVASASQISQSFLEVEQGVVEGNVEMDGDYRPVKGRNVAIDAGDANILSFNAAETDALAGQRIYNNALDCGAVEYDWRGDYAKMLTASDKFAVTSAPPTCVAAPQGVLLIDGTLRSAWAADGRRARFSIKVRVTGGGTLRVLLDGTEVASLVESDGERTLEYRAAGHGIDFEYVRAGGDGDSLGALIASVSRHGGMSITIR